MFSFDKCTVFVGEKKAFSIDSQPIDIPKIEVYPNIVEINGEKFKRPTAVKKDKDGKVIGSVTWITHDRIHADGDYEGITEFCFDVYEHKEYWG